MFVDRPRGGQDRRSSTGRLILITNLAAEALGHGHGMAGGRGRRKVPGYIRPSCTLGMRRAKMGGHGGQHGQHGQQQHERRSRVVGRDQGEWLVWLDHAGGLWVDGPWSRKGDFLCSQALPCPGGRGPTSGCSITILKFDACALVKVSQRGMAAMEGSQGMCPATFWGDQPNDRDNRLVKDVRNIRGLRGNLSDTGK